MRVFISFLLFLFISTSLFSQERRNIIWFTEKSPMESHGFNEGQTVPNLSIKDVYKRRFNLHQEVDKLTILDFRKINCPSCSKNNKFLQRFYKQYSINIISIYDDKYSKAVKDFATKNKMIWTNVQDNAPSSKELLSKQIGLTDSPDYIVISPDNKVLKIFKSGKEAGRLGVFLQQYFNGK